MEKKKTDTTIKVVVLNPPTKEQADHRIKELALHLEKIWRNPQNTG